MIQKSKTSTGSECICLVLSATDQVKAVRELTQHIRKKTSETTINHQTHSLRSWRYCLIKVLAAELRSKKKKWEQGVWYFSWLHRQISLDWYSGSAAKSHSTSTQYCQLCRLSNPGGTPHMKGVGMLIGNLELNP